MGKKIDSIVFDNSYNYKAIDSCITINFNTQRKYVNEFEHPYNYQVLYSVRKNETIPDNIEISNIHELAKVINKDDCLPDFGLFDYKNKDIELDLKDVTLREIYKEVLKKVLK